MSIYMAIFVTLLVLIGFTVFTGAPYVPSKRRELNGLFTELYKLKPTDMLVDMGSGDGVVLRAARRHGASALGYEIAPLLVAISRWLARGDKKQRVVARSYWRAEFPDSTTVVYTFGDTRDIVKMYKKVQSEAARLGHSLSFITYGFSVPNRQPSGSYRAYYLYNIEP